ncbi:hypothetical protein AXK17_30165 (plasmid) [Klebsiella pneumoniae]|nr:hypothetical protein AXK17_30165 [Klebsiella pneumoniae]
MTTEQVESYGRFTGEPDELQLARYFHLDEADKEFIGKSRGDHNRLGIALQIGCVRFLGTFLTDMNHIPSGVRHFTARQLGIRDITVLAEYGQRENTRREHAALIRQHYQYREFAWPWTFRLTRLLSKINGCIYCASVHARKASQLSKDDGAVETLLAVRPGRALSEGQSARWQAEINYAAALSVTPPAATPGHLAELEKQKLDTLEQLDLLQSAAFFAWANRLMLTLGEPWLP